MKLKLDEGLSYRLKPVLEAFGHDVDTIIDEGLRAEEDAVIAETASRNDHMLFTLDRGLGDVRQYAPGDHPGIVVFRPRSAGPGTVNRFVEDFVRSQKLDELSGCVVIADDSGCRSGGGRNFAARCSSAKQRL